MAKPIHFRVFAKSDKVYKICGLYYKHILMIVSDDRKWRQYYKCTINVIDDASLALA
jgi:hypothetical protein